MSTSLETLTGLERRLSFTVNSEEIGKLAKSRLLSLSKTTRMPGFRPGKVPMKMIEQNYGFQVQQEVMGDAVSKSFSDAVQANKLRLAGDPKVDRDEAVQGDGVMGFVATFEVYPDVVLKDLKSIETEKFTALVGEADVDKTVDILRKQRITWADSGSIIVKGDRATIDFAGTLDAVAFEGGTAEDFPFVTGEGKMLPDFESGVIGMKANETKTFDVAFPADYGSEQLAGKTAQFVVTLKKAESPVLPEVNAEFAKLLGVPGGDVAKLRADVRNNLEREVSQRLRGKTKAAVMDSLAGLSEFDIPKVLVSSEQQRLTESAIAELTQRGVDVKNVPIPPDAFTEQAQKRVRLGLLIAELVRAHNLQAKPDQIRKQIEEFAQSYENPSEVVRWYFSDKQRLGEVEGMVLEQNVVDLVLSNAKVNETAVAFEELMANAGSSN